MRVTPITLLLSALVALCAVSVPGTAAATTAPTWSLPAATTTQAPFARTGTLTQITCANADDCFAGAVSQTDTGIIYATTDGGRTWTITRPANPAGGGPFACAPSADSATTPSFCVAISGNTVEDLSVPDAPITGPSNLDLGLDSATALSCPSSALCVAAGTFGSNGEIEDSADPLTGTWASVDADPGHPLTAISCPDAGLCVAADNAGGVVVSTDPAGGTWTRTQIGTGLDGVSCVADQFCLAISSTGQAFSSTDPAAGTWSAVTVPDATDLVGVSCPVSSVTIFCAVTDAGGNVLAANASGLTLGTFTKQTTLPVGVGAISCVDDSFCAVIDGAGVSSTFALRGTNVGFEGAADLGTAVGVDAWTPLASISCPSAGLCVALQQDGRAASSTTPLLQGDQWTISAADPGGTPVALSCPSTTACYGVDSSGRLLWSTNPAAGSWQRVRVDLKAAPVAISCPSTGLCVMIDAAGRIFTSVDPSGGSGAWREVSRTTPGTIHRTTVTLTSVSCATTHFCLVTDGGGWIYTTTDPRGGASAWRATQIWKRRSAGIYSLAQVSCPTARNCTIMGTDAGWYTEAGYDPDAIGSYALASYSPAGAASSWKISHIDSGYVESDASTDVGGLSVGLSCPTTRLCAMVDDTGTALTDTGLATGSYLSVSIDALATPEVSDGEPGLTGVSCFAGGHCVAIDGFGNRFVFGAGAGPLTPVANAHYYAG